MKKIISLFVFSMMMLNIVCAQDDTTVDAYFTTAEMPDMMVFMPGPPDSSSVAFANDVNRYFWGKEMRKDPERANEILARGYRYGENRLVVGAHWQSDTDAARLAASAAYARLHTSERFLEQMKKAREEFKRITDATSVRPTRAPQQNENAAIYDLSGRQVSIPSQGVYIQGGQKIVRP